MIHKFPWKFFRKFPGIFPNYGNLWKLLPKGGARHAKPNKNQQQPTRKISDGNL